MKNSGSYFYTPVILWLAVAYHIFVSIMVQISGHPQTTIGIAGLDWLYDIVPNHAIFSGVLISVAIAAGIGLLREKKLNRKQVLAFIMPQYVVLIISFFTDVGLIVSGKYNDMNIDRVIVLELLFMFMLVSIGHTYAVIERYWIKWTPMHSPD